MTGPTSGRVAALGALALAATLLAGCGNDRPSLPDLTASAPARPTRLANFPTRGMALRVPVRWRLERRTAPTVFRLESGQSQVAAFAYKREEPLPRGKQQLKDAETRLVAQTRKRNLLYTIKSSRRLKVGGDPAVELVGTQRIARQLLLTRSVHVFTGGAEYVFEVLAPRSSFRAASRGVLTPMLRSAKLTGKITARDTRRVRELKRKREAEQRRLEQQGQTTGPDTGSRTAPSTAPDQGTGTGSGTGTGTGTQTAPSTAPGQGTR